MLMVHVPIEKPALANDNNAPSSAVEAKTAAVKYCQDYCRSLPLTLDRCLDCFPNPFPSTLVLTQLRILSASNLAIDSFPPLAPRSGCCSAVVCAVA